MTTTHQAALTVLRQSFAMLRDAFAPLPKEALDWSPVPGGSSFAVLVQHSITSTKFWIACGSGQQYSIATYRAAERTPSFEVRGLDSAELERRIDSALEELAAILAQGKSEHLAAQITWLEDPGTTATGAEALFRAVGHLREHVGHAQLAHDLWLATRP
jgi:uncharacterized damage-inducible protein DinB